MTRKDRAMKKRTPQLTAMPAMAPTDREAAEVCSTARLTAFPKTWRSSDENNRNDLNADCLAIAVRSECCSAVSSEDWDGHATWCVVQLAGSLL